MHMTAIASARGAVEAGKNYCVQMWFTMYLFIQLFNFTAERFVFFIMEFLFFYIYFLAGHDLGLAHAQDPDLVGTATDLAHAAAATAGIYTTVLIPQ